MAVGLLWAEGVALVGLGIAVAVGAFVGRPTDRGAAVTEAVVAVALGVLLGLLGYWLLRGHRTARGPAIVLELMLLPIGYYMIQADVVWAGILAIALGLGVSVLLIAPATRRHLGIE